MRFFLIIIIEILIILGTKSLEVNEITSWLLGINFSVAFFSLNFTFFGYQLSKYKAIYDKITNRQWFNIYVIIILPFLPIITYLIYPVLWGKLSLWILPVVFWSAIDNAKLTAIYLTPDNYLKQKINNKSIRDYFKRLAIEIEKEELFHQKYLDNVENFQIPMHEMDFDPGILGCEKNDLWDSLTVIIKCSIVNNDYPVFRKSINSALMLLTSSYNYKHKPTNDYKINSAIRKISRKRLKSIINRVNNDDIEGIFLQSISNELCTFIMNDVKLMKPLSDVISIVSSDITMIGQSLLSSKNPKEPIKILNTLHAVAELTIMRLNKEKKDNKEISLDSYNVSSYAYYIKDLAITSLDTKDYHFTHRCMETLSYLGCNAAKSKSRKTVAATFECLVQIGRVARSKNIGCFWHRCIIPIVKHAEEFMGHILTWTISDIDENGSFFLKHCAENAYSRIRGVKCEIIPKSNLHPKYWITELTKNGEKIKHVETLSGMYGYSGSLDYSDFSNLQEYVLHEI
ncbi:hypothetical protein D4R71_07910 [bacterium]|nr:MAG: hypothetical protein D4R71_07910 [bacterium]